MAKVLVVEDEVDVRMTQRKLSPKGPSRDAVVVKKQHQDPTQKSNTLSLH
jgi:hypothetical protein